MNKLFWAVFLLLMSTTAQSQSEDVFLDLTVEKITDNINEFNDLYVDPGEWNVSLSFGFGKRSNPLIGGDGLTLLIIPDISYYAEQFYFDNGDLGYTFSEKNNYSFSTLMRFNYEKSYFSKLHPANILFPTENSLYINAQDIRDFPTIDNIGRRDYAIDAGFQFNYYFSNQSNIRVQLLTDISNVYKGSNSLIEYSDYFSYQNLNISTTFGLTWKSDSLVDYYYGLTESDNVQPVFYYKGKSSIQPYLKLSAIYPINNKWKIVSKIQYIKLGSSISNSPIVQKTKATLFYLGVAYGF